MAFIESIAKKLLNASYTTLKKYLTNKGIQLAEWKRKAMDSFLLWGEEQL